MYATLIFVAGNCVDNNLHLSDESQALELLTFATFWSEFCALKLVEGIWRINFTSHRPYQGNLQINVTLTL